MVRILSWNIAHRDECWDEVFNSGYDVALIQEASEPQVMPSNIFINPGEWRTAGYSKRNWRTAIVKLSNNVDIEWIHTAPIDNSQRENLAVSRMGTLSAAKILPKDGGEPFLVVSCYAAWEKPASGFSSDEIYSDASAHRLISDISGLIGAKKPNRILLAGDFNILNRYGEHSNKYWKERYSSVFDRFEAIGVPLIGPNYPNGRQASPWPDELPEKSNCVPTYFHNRQTPETATRQLDFVFASRDINAEVVALNEVKGWGPSDHCRIEIKV